AHSRLGQHLRRLSRHQPHARDVQEEGKEMSAQPDIAALAYLVSGVLFILALRGLSSPETSRAGNIRGMAGMALAVATTLWLPRGGGAPSLGAVPGGSFLRG